MTLNLTPHHANRSTPHPPPISRPLLPVPLSHTPFPLPRPSSRACSFRVYLILRSAAALRRIRFIFCCPTSMSATNNDDPTQARIRALKSKPDEKGILTLLRQLKHLQGVSGREASIHPTGVGGGVGGRGGGGGASANSPRVVPGTVPRTSPRNVPGTFPRTVPTNAEIEKILLEEL